MALQLGHRDSVDFDFFSPQKIDTKKLFEKIKKVFAGHKILKVQEEENTLGIIIDGNIKLSFLTYQYPLLEKLINEKDIKLASPTDIGCMKLSAITSRASNKDYIDLFFILKSIPLKILLKKANKKFPTIDNNLILKSIVYFKDIEKEPIKYRNSNRISFEEVKIGLIEAVGKL